MDTERFKITNIISSVLSIMLKREATKVDIQVENNARETRMTISGNMKNMTEKEIEVLRKKLNNTRAMEIEEPYWELSETLEEENLYLLGIMVDSFHLEFNEEIVHLTLVREKEGPVEVN